MISTGLECFLHGWNEFYRDGMLSRGLECLPEGWNSFEQSWNAF
jgi:hypothetical protein